MGENFFMKTVNILLNSVDSVNYILYNKRKSPQTTTHRKEKIKMTNTTYKVEMIAHKNQMKAPSNIMGSKWYRIWANEKFVVYEMTYSYKNKKWDMVRFQSIWVKEIGEEGYAGKGNMREFRVNVSKMEIRNNKENQNNAQKEAKKQAWNYIKKMEA